MKHTATSPLAPHGKGRAMPTPEGAVLKSIMEYLAARRVLCFRMNTGAVVSEYKGKKRFMRFGTPGMGDVLAFRQVYDPACNYFHIDVLWLEVKAKGKQSEAQKSFQAMVEAQGHRYAVVRSVEDVEALLR